MLSTHKGYNTGYVSKKEKLNTNNHSICWYCGGQLFWQSDFNYDEVFGEGEGIVSYLHCSNCGADVEYSLREDDENE